MAQTPTQQEVAEMMQVHDIEGTSLLFRQFAAKYGIPADDINDFLREYATQEAINHSNWVSGQARC